LSLVADPEHRARRVTSRTPDPPFRHRHTLRVRYGEVDQQGVVFNANYFAYVDDAVELWLEGLRSDPELSRHPDLARWDFMLKKVTLEWSGSVGSGDRLAIDMAVVRWGRSSFEVHFRGSHEGRRIFDATITYVSVIKGENRPYETPPLLREYLGDAVVVT
jgi:acyl-CoA thioester hydrolase